MANYSDDDIPNFAENTIRKLDTLLRMTAIELFRRVILKTPVDTGRARGNWQTEIGRFTKGEIEQIKSEEQVLKEMIEKVTQGDIEKGFYMANNLPYIQKLEYGGYPQSPKVPTGKTIGGFSKQAPQGMVRISLEEVKKDFNRILNDVVNKK